jgi:hypothetical protein
MPMGPGLWPALLDSARGVWRQEGVAAWLTLAWWNALATLRFLRGLARRASQGRGRAAETQ